jgi:hypothetical protein
MAEALALSPNAFAVEPGVPVTCIATVRNTTSVVESYTVSVIGDAAAWTDVAPNTISLLPDAERTVDIIFRPPRGPKPATGPVPFAVKIVPASHPDQSVVEEGTVTINPFTALVPLLVPQTSKGVRTGHHVLKLTNEGNSPAHVKVSASDPDGNLRLKGGTDTVEVGPGVTGAVRIAAHPRRIQYIGSSKHHPFQVVVEPSDAAPLIVNGGISQRAVLPPWLPKAIIVAVVAIVGLALLANQRSQVHDAAANGTTTTSTTATTTTTTSGGNTTTSSGGGTTTTSSSGTANQSTTVTEKTLTNQQAEAISSHCKDIGKLTTPSSQSSSDSSSASPRFSLETDSNSRKFSFASDDDRLAAATVLGGYKQICLIGEGTDNPAQLAMVLEPASTDPSTPPSAEKCVTYDPNSLSTTQVGDATFVQAKVQDGTTQQLQQVVDEDAGNLLIAVAKSHTKQCWIGGGDTFTTLVHDTDAPSDTFSVLEYWR